MDISSLLVYVIVLFNVVFSVNGAVGRTNRKRQGHRRREPEEQEMHTLESLRKKYGKKDPPTLDRPTEVKLGIYINSFHSISEQTMDFMISFYLRQSWRDPRLQFTPVDGVKEMRASYDTVDRIWTPDVFFRNEKRALFHGVTQPNLLMRINATGHVWFVRKISAKLSCPMDLQKYPMDKQTCPMMFESFGYTMDTMYFSWLDDPCDIDPSVELPQFTLEKWELYDCSQNYTAGAFPCLEIKFFLQRAIGFFLIQVYIPSILIVILSWVSFWISIDAIPARVSLGLLTVLTMTTQSTSANNSLPKVSYIKAIDVWMSMCLIFVFVALLEFALVNVVSRRGIRIRRPPPPPPPPVPHSKESDSDKRMEQMGFLENGRERRMPGKMVDPEGKIKAQKIDKLSRKLFPLAFLLFNIVYWIIYTVPNAL